ncbi:MAG: undecaprenyl/decaprenyl-phosphate alpha-N-acetylglucosaminyl 1-phosphate transferase [Nitrospiraceae bacterium]|nr:undecaprenyl/decaprenyl-phosphate alpha-N-acetylglucosaminyl 1-phosphate transferase [Nitrospiraceae bacterium]
MGTMLFVFSVALLLALGATPIARNAARRTGLVDRPSARKLHTAPTPLMGGVAIYLAVILAFFALGRRHNLHQFLAILVGASLVSLMGLWDDRFNLSPPVKLLGQILAGSLLIASGVSARLFHYPVLDYLITLFWVVGITNSINLLDNMDGLAGGVAGIAAAFFTLLAAMNGQYLVGALAAAVAGACIGFLAYNYNPASIFMGDSGSLFLGFMLAAVGIKLRFPQNVAFVTWMVPVLVLGLPIFDTSLVFFSRLRRGQNPISTPGKDHCSHRLVKLGYTHREAVLTCYLVAGALGVMAIFVTQANIVEGYTVGGIILAIALYAIFWLERHAGVGLNEER